MKILIQILLNIAFVVYSHEQNTSIPVVLWHGMGDSCCNPLSLGRLMKVMKANMPNNSYIKSIQIGDDMGQDIENSFKMNVNLQVQNACKQIAKEKNLANGYNAIGFSQGSQFLRAVAQRCPNPPMLNLISIGGQHQGVYGLPHCFYPQHKWCDYLRKLLNYGAYWGWVQNHFVQAEYWHDPLKEQDYIKYSVFLADINNEREMNYIYRKNLMQLKNFVLVMFESDSMMIPKESAWFGFYTPGQNVNITKLEDSVLYQVDRIGLKRLNEENKLHFISLPGDHLRFTEEWFVKEIIQKYLV
ncbi:palmitoyl-protein thioesterase 1 [Planococcus citri]|uniref:palmitoyl-protein thioesterase 1 n=1 Tax=Planococcus citri TaxID=170843 RepID=UPI0031F78A25